MVDDVYATGGLLDALLDVAARREPDDVSTLLTVTATADLRGADRLDPQTPVFTDFYFPASGRGVDAVFGVDVTVPHGQAQGRFVSHPRGELDVTTSDDLHEVVIVAVPPWSRDDVAAFDRSGRRLRLHVVDAAPPDELFWG